MSQTLSLNVIVNGEPRNFSGALSIHGLLTALGLDPKKIAVERNLEIVPRSLYAATALLDGDRIEIVAFVGGG